MALVFLLAAGSGGCRGAAGPSDPAYPFTGLPRVAGTPAAARARADYPEVFQVVDDPSRTEELDSRALRRDLSRAPVDARNYAALSAVAVSFFELHARAEGARGGERYLGYSFQATKVIAIPWRLYGEIEEPALRSAILDFFEDVLLGDKPGLESVRGRYTGIVEDLGRKEADADLRRRIDSLVERAVARTPGAGR